jgi:hypothetical protein
VALINWFPLTTDVMFRKGYTQWATGINGTVQSLMVYNGPTQSKMIGATNGGSFYDVSSNAAVGAPVVTGQTNGQWESINVATPGGNFMYCVNGVDSPQLFNGTTWTAITGISSPAITGVTTSNLTSVNLFKNRVWFTEKNSLKIWYLPTNSIGGVAHSLDFQSIAYRGGYLVGMATWTIDAGYGVDDLAVFITSQGQFIVYRGSDPSFDATWALAGVFDIGAPVGKRCYFKWAGDVLVITQDGVVPMAQELQSSRLDPRVAITDKIQSAMSEAVTLYGGSFGWELEYYAKANMLILNVPVTATSQEQYVMNTITKSWGQFQGFNANCWAIFGDEPYFGAAGYVGKMWSALSDNASQISGKALQAFSDFGDAGSQKRFTMMRPILSTDGAPSINGSINVDFDTTLSNAALSFTPVNYASWDSAIWDSSIWGGELNIQKNWQGASAVGYWGATQLDIMSSSIETHWVATTIVMEKGGVL